MKPTIIYILFIFLLANTACKSYSRFTIDDKPQVFIDSNLYGIWKAVEDTNKKDYILIQSPYDLFHHLVLMSGMDSNEYYAMMLDFYHDTVLATESTVRHRAGFTKGVMEMERRKFLERNGYYYYITRMDANGTNPHYQQWSSFLSVVGNCMFLNIPYRYTPQGKDGNFVNNHTNEECYFFVRIIKATPDTLTTAIVADPTMRFLDNSISVRERIEKHINDPAFYSDTLHFCKVTGYHYSLNDSKKWANK